MTQHIGASFFPVETLKQLIGPYMGSFKTGIEIPGLLIVDTPGHEAFTNLRRRGGSVADIAILVVDALRGFEAQTYECIEILKARKTPFIVAVNKIDRIPGWTLTQGAPILKSYASQSSFVREALDNRLYAVMGEFSRLNFKTDRFDHIRDFTINIALSADKRQNRRRLIRTSYGSGWVNPAVSNKTSYRQRRVPQKAQCLRLKRNLGLGLTLNAIVYDGTLRKDDLIVVGGQNGPISARVRAILVPKPLDEMRDPRDKFTSVDCVYASAGVKIVAPDLEGAFAGAPLFSVPYR